MLIETRERCNSAIVVDYCCASNRATKATRFRGTRCSLKVRDIVKPRLVEHWVRGEEDTQVVQSWFE